jgi:putative NADH-flavin reductase
MMKIALIGATGFVGKALLGEALARNHEVTAISRHPEMLGKGDPRLKALGIDVFESEALSAALRGHDAVLSAYNAGWANPRYREDFLAASEAIERATEKAGVKRLLVVGGAGSLEAAPGVQLVDTPGFPEEYRAAAKAVRDYLDLLRKNKSLEWTFLSPAIIMGPEVKTGRTGRYRIGGEQPVFDARGVSTISVEDLAVALLDELERGRFINRRFTVAY